ncbi:MAG: hypothetical protein NVV68_06375 [Dokdonella sp.]|nr:hypothetical protein [Dokdonella sp.]
MLWLGSVRPAPRVGRQQQAAVLIADVALGGPGRGVAFVAEGVGADQLVVLLHAGLALQLEAVAVGRAAVLGRDVGRRSVAVAVARQVRHVEIEQVARLAQRPVGLAGRAAQRPDRTRRGGGRDRRRHRVGRGVGRLGGGGQREGDGQRERMRAEQD